MQEAPGKSRRSAFSEWTHPSLSSHEIRLVAVRAMCDPRVVVRYLYGESQRSTVRLRVTAALEACGHASLVGTEEQRTEATAEVLRKAAIPKPSTVGLRPFAGLVRPQRA